MTETAWYENARVETDADDVKGEHWSVAANSTETIVSVRIYDAIRRAKFAGPKDAE